MDLSNSISFRIDVLPFQPKKASLLFLLVLEFGTLLSRSCSSFLVRDVVVHF